MWPFKKKITVEDAFATGRRVKFQSANVTKIEDCGTGYGPQSIGKMPEVFMFYITFQGKGYFRMVDEGTKLELVD